MSKNPIILPSLLLLLFSRTIISTNFTTSATGILANRKSIKLGVLLSTDEKEPFHAEKRIHHFNSRRLHHLHIFEPVVSYISINDTFFSLKSACHLIENHQVMAVVAIQELGALSDSLGSIFSFVGIPFLQSSYELKWEHERTFYGHSINLYPETQNLRKALLQTIKHIGIESLIILYYNEIDILLWKDFVDEKSRRNVIPPSFLRLDHQHTTLRVTLQKIKSAPFKNVLYLGRDRNRTLFLLKEAQILGLLTPERHFILATLDLSNEHLEPYMYSGVNITFMTLSGLNSQDSVVHTLFDDTLLLLSKRYKDSIIDSYPKNLSCRQSHNWKEGKKIYQGMKNSETLGSSGVIHLDSRGKRSDFSLDIHGISFYHTVETIGHWTTQSGLLWKGMKENIEILEKDVPLNLLRKKPLVITTILNPPYIMKKRDAKDKTGIDCYEGFIIDLANELASIIGFNYTIALTDAYGSMDKFGNWNGMILELLEERADMAMADLTISFQREQVVDFTMPFLDLGISILYVNTPKNAINFFAFLSPLSLNVWMLMILGGFMVSLTMLFIGRYSPFETEDLDSTEGTTPFSSFHNCLWFSIASWVQQGCDFLPRAISGRLVASIWWFFTLIMISSYTANLAAFLTIERLESPIESARDLASQTKIRYGAVKSGSTSAFFKESTDEMYEKMGRFMSRYEDDVMVDSNQDGLEKVLEESGGYAFFMESTTIEYQIERNCKLQQIGGLIDSKSYGIALPQGSSLRAHISSAIIKLKEKGVIRQLKTKWWKKERGGGACENDDKQTGTVNELNLENVGGIFMVLLLGLFLGVSVATCEHYYRFFKEKMKKVSEI